MSGMSEFEKYFKENVEPALKQSSKEMEKILVSNPEMKERIDKVKEEYTVQKLIKESESFDYAGKSFSDYKNEIDN